MPSFSFPDQSGFPTTYKDVLTPDFLNSLYQNVNDQEAQGVGEAQSEAVRRGLTGTPFEASAVGAAKEAGNRGRQSTLSDFLYNLAGIRENENIIGEQQQYGTSERLGREAFQAQQSALDRQLQRDMQSERGKQLQQQDLFGLYSGLAETGGAGAGYALGGPVGGYIGSKLFKTQSPSWGSNSSGDVGWSDMIGG